MGKDTISQALNQCLRNFTALTESEALARYEPEVSRRRWLDELGRLRVWSGNIGAHQSGQSSLDFRLRDASHLREETIKLLNRMFHILQNVMEVVNEDGEEELEVEIEDDDEIDDMTEVQQLYRNIVDIVNSLFQISMAVRRPADHDRLLNMKIKNESFFEPWARQHISHKYPDADDAVISRLSVTMARQKAILKYRERHRAKLEEGLYEYIETDSTKLSETVATEMAADNDQLHFLETASNSGLSQTSYASSLMATQAAASIPNPPKTSRNRKPFECPYCFHIITIKHKKEWARHIFRDLMPYVCLSNGCATPSRLYESRHQWFIHMCEAHAQSQNDIACPLCLGEIQLSSFEKHAGRHLEELALFVLPRKDIDEESDFEIASSDYSMDPAGSDRDSKPPVPNFWSVSETENFPLLLAEFGRDFESISRIMQTKSPQMVKNYFQRQIVSGRRDFLEIAAIAESKKARGKPLTASKVHNLTPRRHDKEPSSPTRSGSAKSPEPNVDKMRRDQEGTSSNANQYWVDEDTEIMSDDSFAGYSTSSNPTATNSFSIGPFICTYTGCTAPPFATQYLLDVHLQDKPHFCPVEGCPHGPGGKGFKRKREMIRHGVVHESPGYVCPFCHNSWHRYSQPDSLLR
ncbi:hypothetical protein BDW67DRAFT_95799 [Aspergillus spinulosporus]